MHAGTCLAIHYLAKRLASIAATVLVVLGMLLRNVGSAGSAARDDAARVRPHHEADSSGVPSNTTVPSSTLLGRKPSSDAIGGGGSRNEQAQGNHSQFNNATNS